MTVRLSDDIKDALDRLCKRENRSMSNMIQTLIKNEAVKSGCYVPPPVRHSDPKV